MVVSGAFFSELKSLWFFVEQQSTLHQLLAFPNGRAEMWKSEMLELSTKTTKLNKQRRADSRETSGHSPPILRLCNKNTIKGD